MAYSLGIDASTQSCSAVVIDTAKRTIVAEASVNFGQRLPNYKAPSGFIPDGKEGEVHADPCMWLDALEILLEELSEQIDLSAVKSISGAGQQHGSVYLGAEWRPTVQNLRTERSLSEQIAPTLTRATSPIWMDRSTREECREIASAAGGDQAVCKKSGSIAIERFTGPQIHRFYKTAAESYARTTRIHLVSSFLSSILSGSDAPIDTGDGAGMNLLNINSWNWDPSLMEASAPGLAEKLPPVVQGASTVGTIADYFVRKFGFSAGTPVTVFTGDNPSSLVGMGASEPGKVVISLGTSDTFFAAMPAAVSDPNGFGHVFGNPAGGCMSLQCFVNGSLAREAVKDRFSYSWEQFTEALEKTPCGNEGNWMLPFYRPEISPRTDQSKPILGGSEAFRNWQVPDAAIRACVEGQFMNMRRCTEWMQLHPDVIYLTGGASRNDAIAQIAADVFQASVRRLAITSSVALGGALRAAANSLGFSLPSLQAIFCKPVQNTRIEPKVEATTYDKLMQALSNF